VNEKGDEVEEPGETEPAPFSVIVTFVALPPNVFPATVNAVVPQAKPLMLLRVTVGLFEHCPNVFIEIKRKTKTKR
jgi:hypothetical protein